jgi:hypothetical protein
MESMAPAGFSPNHPHPPTSGDNWAVSLACVELQVMAIFNENIHSPQCYGVLQNALCVTVPFSPPHSLWH